jgi:hypothetical protein
MEKEDVSQVTPDTTLARWTIVRLHINRRFRKRVSAIFALRLAYARAEYWVAALEGLDNGITDVHRRPEVY